MLCPVYNFDGLAVGTAFAGDAHVRVDVFVYAINLDFLDCGAAFWALFLGLLKCLRQTLLVKDLVTFVTLHCSGDVSEIQTDTTDEILADSLVLLDNLV